MNGPILIAVTGSSPEKADTLLGVTSNPRTKSAGAQNRGRSPKPALIFIHIPKAAGTTLNKIIDQQYSSREMYRIDGRQVPESIERLKCLSEKEREKIRCVKGHMPFGLHKYLPTPSTYITILRHPIDRLLSHYNFVLRTPTHYLYQEVVSKKMSLEDYVRSGVTSELDNGQVRLLSGIASVDTVFGHGPISRETLETAKTNLREHFSGIGISERFNESLLLFAHRLGWKKIYYKKLNVSQERVARSELPAPVLKALEGSNAYDMELYDYAKRIFEESLRDQGINRKKKMIFGALNRCNRVYTSSKIYGTKKIGDLIEFLGFR